MKGQEFSVKLSIAALSGDLEYIRNVLKQCKECEAVKDLSSIHLSDPIYIAAQSPNHLILIEILDFCGTNSIDQLDKISGLSPLHIASIYGKEVIVSTLLSYGANSALLTRYGKTALQLAQSNSHYKVVKALKECQDSSKSKSIFKSIYQGFTALIDGALNTVLFLARLFLRALFAIFNLFHCLIKKCLFFRHSTSSYYFHKQSSMRLGTKFDDPESECCNCSVSNNQALFLSTRSVQESRFLLKL